MSSEAGVRGEAPAGSGARGRRERGPPDAKTKLSKGLSWLLRHHALEHGLKPSPDGYVPLDEVLALPQFSSATVAEVEEVVRSCPKQRFTLSVDASGRRLIRANQGHSMKDVIDDEALCTPVTSAEEAPVAIHGTYTSKWAGIKASGLKCMSRQHVHFAAGELGEDGVKSGMRTSTDVYIYLDVAKALAAGMKILRSSNNVILTSGFDGVIAPEFFEKVINKRTGEHLWPLPS